jgi:acylphosphatase
MSTVRVIVTGRVQGVFYRQSARDRAAALGLSGWVRNLSDGTVELQAVGPRQTVETLLAWCKEGPPHAVVQDIAVTWLEEDELNESTRAVGFTAGFIIR